MHDQRKQDVRGFSHEGDDDGSLVQHSMVQELDSAKMEERVHEVGKRLKSSRRQGVQTTLQFLHHPSTMPTSLVAD
jgi:hypothetical protein